MNKRDFFPIVYRILAALYKNLKEDREKDDVIFVKDLYDISKNYMNYIIKYLIDEKFIMYASYRYFDGKITFINLERSVITPEGIEYLQNNNMMQKAEMFFKDKKEMIPFL